MANPKEHFASLTSKTEPQATEPAKEKTQRYHVVRGVPHRVVKSQFDPKGNCVVDTIEIKKTVKNRKGDDVEVTLHRQMRSADAGLQAKHQVPDNGLVDLEVTNG